MRGIDYRASTLGITLFNCASYENMREALQGLCRVGRFEDLFKIYMIEGTALIDEKKLLEYNIKLMKFCDEATTNKVTMSAVIGSKNLQTKSVFASDTATKARPEVDFYVTMFPASKSAQLQAKNARKSFYDDDYYYYDNSYTL